MIIEHAKATQFGPELNETKCSDMETDDQRTV
jgi:hypothetical protein